MNIRKFSEEELKERAIRRVAQILFEQWEESGGGDTRLFDWLINDRFTLIGKSKMGDEYREHVVPRVVIRDICIDLFKENTPIDSVSKVIDRLLKIARISTQEARDLDIKHGLKKKMPEGWNYKDGDIYARLKFAKIEIT